MNSILTHKYAKVGVGVLALIVLVVWFRADSLDIEHAVPEAQSDVFSISDPSRKQLFYGTLDSLPHTYAFVLKEPTLFDVRIMMPDTAEEARNISGILIKEPIGKGRVVEIARLRAQEAGWETANLAIGGTVRNGPSFTQELDAGSYRFEVSTPDNREPYLITVGTHEERTIGYGTFIAELSALRSFLGYSAVTSVHVYAPVLLFLLLGYAGYLWHTGRRVI